MNQCSSVQNQYQNLNHNILQLNQNLYRCSYDSDTKAPSVYTSQEFKKVRYANYIHTHVVDVGHSDSLAQRKSRVLFRHKNPVVKNLNYSSYSAAFKTSKGQAVQGCSPLTLELRRALSVCIFPRQSVWYGMILSPPHTPTNVSVIAATYRTRGPEKCQLFS